MPLLSGRVSKNFDMSSRRASYKTITRAIKTWCTSVTGWTYRWTVRSSAWRSLCVYFWNNRCRSWRTNHHQCQDEKKVSKTTIFVFYQIYELKATTQIFNDIASGSHNRFVSCFYLTEIVAHSKSFKCHDWCHFRSRAIK